MKQNTTIAAVLRACAAQRVLAGERHDGHAVATINPLIAVLNEVVMGGVNLTCPDYLALTAELDRCVSKRRFCEVHDQEARGELGARAYYDALANLRGERS